MDKLKEYSLPIKGFKQEHYEFDFRIGDSFFDCFEDPIVKEGDVSVTVDLEKRTGMMELYFDFEGTVKTECDRCLAGIDLPIAGTEHLIVKYSEETQEDTDEIIFIHPDAHELNLANFIYEYICLAIPITKTYDCENDEFPPCNQEVLKMIKGESNLPVQSESEDTENPFGNLFKDINLS